MQKTKLLLLSSIFIVCGVQNAMSSTAVTPSSSSKRTFTKDDLQEEVDPNETSSDATEKLEDAKRRRMDLTAEITEKQKELQAVTKEEQEARLNAGNEGIERLKRKIAGHMDNIKNFDEQIKQKAAEQAAELDRLKKEQATQIKELNENNANVLKELNDQKALSMAKKAAREAELVALKNASKMAGVAQTNQQLEQKGALNAAILNQAGKPLKKVNAVVEPQVNTVPQQVAAKNDGLGGGLFGGLKALQATVENASKTASGLTETAGNLADTATNTITNATNQANGIKEQLASAQESIASVLPSTGNVRLQSIKIESNTFTEKTISI